MWVLALSLIAGPSSVLNVTPLGDGLMVAGRDYLAWGGKPGYYTAMDAGCDRIYGPATSPDGSTVAVWAGSDSGDRVLLVRRGGVEVLGPWETAGLPCWDASGALWFSADGELLRDGEPAGASLDAHHVSVSPEGDRVVFTDREDRILVTDLVTGATGEVSVEHRFFAPFFTPSGSIVSPSLDGGIWLFDGEEAISVGPGDSPAWWVEEDRLVFIRTTDDGQRLLTSDLWSWNREEGAVRLSETPDVLETSPTPVASGIYYVDAASDRPGFLEAAPK